MYFWSYRNEGAFHEKVTNTILDDIVAATQPRFMPHHRQLVRARRHLHQRGRRAPPEGLEAAARGRPARGGREPSCRRRATGRRLAGPTRSTTCDVRPSRIDGHGVFAAA
jgi:hypothetical protein